MARVFAVGVGPGSSECVTGEAARIIRECDLVIGYKHTLETIRGLLGGKRVVEVTMKTQEDAYQSASRELGDGTLVVPFTGDASFSESEVVDRLAEIFGSVQVVPGISSVQVAAARAGIALDKARVITMHVTGPIEDKKEDLCAALSSGLSVVLVPRPWPGDPERNFMPSEIAAFLRMRGFDTGSLRACVYEMLTTPEERAFEGRASDLEGKEFSGMSVVVLGQNRPDSYMNYKWQWKGPSAPG